MHKTVLAIAALAVAGLTAGSASAQTSVAANITADTTWTLAGSPYVLQQPIFVNNGANLTIEAGVIVRGQPRTGAVVPGVVAGSPGALVVTRDGSANIIGTAAAPIIFTTAAVDNDADGAADDLDGDGFIDPYPGFDPADCPGACALPGLGLFYDANPSVTPLAPLDSAGNANISLWGSVVIEGNAPTNQPRSANGGGVVGVGIVEGLTVPGFPEADANYGGVDSNDSSGAYRYISLRHGGDEIGNGNELNGLTMAGVGRGTEFSYIEIYCNFDDGIEWFGGTVDGDHLAMFFAGDDQVDIDQGYSGTLQYVFAVHAFFNQNSGALYGADSGDAIGEWDGDDWDEPLAACATRADTDDNLGDSVDTECFPVTTVQIYNLTGISNAPGKIGTAPVSPNAQNRGIRMRNGFAGSLLNSVVVDTGTQAGIRESGGGNPTFATWASRDVARVVSTTLAGGAAVTDAGVLQAMANGDAAVPREYAGSGTANWDNAGSFSLVNSDQSFNPQGTGNTGFCNGAEKAGSPLDPRIDLGSSDAAAVAGGVTTGPDPAGAAFRGAFPASGPLWTDGWTAADQCGLL